MTPNNRQPTPSKTEATHLRAPVGRNKAICVIAAIVLVGLLLTGCSRASEDSPESSCPPAPDGSGQLSEYFHGFIGYSHPYSDDVTPNRVKLIHPLGWLNALDSIVSKGVEDEDEFVLELRDELGGSLKSINFFVQPEIDVYDADPDRPIPPPFKSAYFDFFAGKPIDYTNIAVLYEDNELEMIEEHSANTPCLSVSWPTEEQAFDESDHILISFEANDTDEDELFYTINYSADGGNAYQLEKYAVMEKSFLSMMVSVASLERSDQARLAILVTDGERSMVWESPIFAISERPSESDSKDI